MRKLSKGRIRISSKIREREREDCRAELLKKTCKLLFMVGYIAKSGSGSEGEDPLFCLFHQPPVYNFRIVYILTKVPSFIPWFLSL